MIENLRPAATPIVQPEAENQLTNDTQLSVVWLGQFSKFLRMPGDIGKQQVREIMRVGNEFLV
jgi:hypothetical protein